MMKINYKNIKEIIKTLTSIIAPDKQEVLAAFSTKYYKAFDKTLKHNGKEYTLNLFKLIHNQAVDLALRQEVQPIPFHKSGNDGVSHLLGLTRPLLLSNDDKVIRLVLTVTRVYEAIRLKPELDSEPITKPYSGEVDLEEFNIGLRRYLLRAKWFLKLKTIFRRIHRPTERIRGRIRKGPNGQCNVTSHYDAIALWNTDQNLYENLQRWNVLQNQEFINESLDFCRDESLQLALGKVKTGRIALISERAGKSRPISIADIWSQNSLQGFHNTLMKLLRRLPTDSTFDQNKAFFRIQRSGVKRRWIGSADLTKFTDRFPIALCKAVLYCLTDSEELSNLWVEIQSNRDFWYEESTYRWSVGSPLGLLSGWALNSLTHHCLVQYSYHQSMAKWNFFRNYQLLGDDITIWNRVVYRAYVHNLWKIGVEVNKTKSMKSVPGQYRFEFVKRLSLNGKELTGFPFDLLQNASKSIYDYVDLVRYLVETKFFLSGGVSQQVVPKYLSLRGKRYLEILLWEGDLLCPDDAGNIGDASALHALRRQMLLIRLSDAKKISERLDKILGPKSLEQYLISSGVKFSPNLFHYKGGNAVHPLVESLNYTGYQLYELMEHLSQLSTSDDLITQPVYPELNEFEYLPLPHMGAYFERPGRRDPVRTKAHSKLVLQANTNLNYQFPAIV